ncbi:DUF6587 family protein [Fulvimonas soli]|jgi:hypothetical protein|uniref:Uncharacterized protein n=1 Tax=Fulvimonas soli TaxID=155197 RepID=A0A316I3X9_9GAMM|nr:DUF6587 family protein [Fulvimonas soli]PWK87696.1 hypothetical protein C7456_106189 [Fulvimonas soli]TNY27950.1 hypothetical protein BV497_00810 [Fulvimonas soli]
MSAGLLAQYAAIGLAVLASALVAFRKLAPQLSSRWLAAASIRLARRDSRLAQALGRRLQPKQATGDCSDGCSTCGACGPKPPAAARGEAMPLEFRPRAK